MDKNDGPGREELISALRSVDETLEEFCSIAVVNEKHTITMLPYQAAKMARMLHETRGMIAKTLGRIEEKP